MLTHLEQRRCKMPGYMQQLSSQHSSLDGPISLHLPILPSLSPFYPQLSILHTFIPTTDTRSTTFELPVWMPDTVLQSGSSLPVMALGWLGLVSSPSKRRAHVLQNSDNGFVRDHLFPCDTGGHLAVPSNVTRLCRALLPETPEGMQQIIYYQAGVGTSDGPLSVVYGGATGEGLSENIRGKLRAYTFFHSDGVFLLVLSPWLGILPTHLRFSLISLFLIDDFSLISLFTE